MENEISLKNIQVLNKLGGGNFGEVYQGKMESSECCIEEIEEK